ncbi:MAG: TIM barrel protein [Planctomycetota bacterium]|nr:TIM barrel protein [Planctomycetota bacterium]
MELLGRLCDTTLSRRRAVSAVAVTAAGVACGWQSKTKAAPGSWQPRYILASAMYGNFPLTEILPEVAKTGAESIDLWPKPHGTQREEIDSLGEATVAAMLAQHQVKLGGIACYRLGAFNLADEFALAGRLGDGVVLVTLAQGGARATGTALKSEIKRFLEKLRPSIAAAEETGGVLAIENHSNSLINSPDSIRWFGELVTSDRVGVALAPHHLPQDGELVASLARELGPRLKFVYAQQHGKGSKEKLPKQDELLQLPGRGPLDFGPLMRQLAEMRFAGPVEIFMHPVPRGVPILDTVPAITAEINRARDYLNAV